MCRWPTNLKAAREARGGRTVRKFIVFCRWAPSALQWRCPTAQGHIMRLPRRKFLHLAACATALPVVSRIARAQSYPTRPITFNVPFPAGGPTDAIARVMGERMRVALGQPILIENVSGAAGSIGVGRVAHASPDGYTVGVGHWSTHFVNGAIYDLSYDLLKDFGPVPLLPSNPPLLCPHTTAP